MKKLYKAFAHLVLLSYEACCHDRLTDERKKLIAITESFSQLIPEFYMHIGEEDTEPLKIVFDRWKTVEGTFNDLIYNPDTGKPYSFNTGEIQHFDYDGSYKNLPLFYISY